jgi:Resolvase, N terminal domain
MARRAPPRARSAPGQPYYRVPRAQQGASGLGLEAQREAVSRHVASVNGGGGVIVAEFQEIESGKKTTGRRSPRRSPPAGLRHAALIIAKLDRLARNVQFISSLMESGVDFVACDNPHATRLTIHILAAVAEHEREMISARTTAALAVVSSAIAATGSWTSRRSGLPITRLGNPHLRPGSRSAARVARQAPTDLSNAHAADVLPYIVRARRAGCTSLGELARALSDCGIRTPAGGTEWRAAQVSRVLARAARPTETKSLGSNGQELSSGAVADCQGRHDFDYSEGLGRLC